MPRIACLNLPLTLSCGSGTPLLSTREEQTNFHGGRSVCLTHHVDLNCRVSCPEC